MVSDIRPSGPVPIGLCGKERNQASQERKVWLYIVGWEIAKTLFKTDGTPYPTMLGNIIVEYLNDKSQLKQSGVGTGKLLTRAFRLEFANNPDSFMNRIIICTAQEFTANEGVMSCPRAEMLRIIQDKNKI